LPAQRDHPGVIHQDIEPAKPGLDFFGEPAYLRQAGQVSGHDRDLGERHALADLGGGRRTALPDIAPMQPPGRAVKTTTIKSSITGRAAEARGMLGHGAALRADWRPVGASPRAGGGASAGVNGNRA
jgi:hypothetical protein